MAFEPVTLPNGGMDYWKAIGAEKAAKKEAAIRQRVEQQDHRAAKAHKRARKAQTRVWLGTEAGKLWLARKQVERQEEKHLRRMQKEAEIMAESGASYDCRQCLHGIGRHCTNDLPHGCPSFARAKAVCDAK